MAEDDSDRTEPATGRRISEARNRGHVPTSRELQTFAALLAAVAGLRLFGPRVMNALHDMMLSTLSFDSSRLGDGHALLELLYQESLRLLIAIAPLLAVFAVAAVIGPFLLHGWLFTSTTLAPDLSRLNPLNGLRRMFSLSSFVELGKALLKAILIGGPAIWVLWRNKEMMVAMVRADLSGALDSSWDLLLRVLFYGMLGALVIAAIDVPFQLWQYYKSLRMSKQEIRDEMKEAEGDPQIKARIRSMQREAARRRMMAAVPKADVIVTNPTHYAVALEYHAGMTAPKVSAKGMGAVAERIMELARENNVPILRTPPFARALYRHAELDQEIPAALYTAAAEVLAYVYQLKLHRTQGAPMPTEPGELPVPADLVPPEQPDIARP